MSHHVVHAYRAVVRASESCCLIIKKGNASWGENDWLPVAGCVGVHFDDGQVKKELAFMSDFLQRRM